MRSIINQRWREVDVCGGALAKTGWSFKDHHGPPVQGKGVGEREKVLRPKEDHVG